MGKRALRCCPVCGVTYYAGSDYCSRRCKDRQRFLSGENQRRMLARSAKQKGVTVEEYEARRQARQQEAVLERQRQSMVRSAAGVYRDQRRLRRAVCRDLERERQQFSAYVLAKYHADPDNWSSRKKRRRLFERDGWKCRVCGQKVDDQLPRGHARRAVAMHIVAKATGGEWTDENMATGCHRCNVKDGVNKLPIQFSLTL